MLTVASFGPHSCQCLTMEAESQTPGPSRPGCISGHGQCHRKTEMIAIAMLFNMALPDHQKQNAV